MTDWIRSIICWLGQMAGRPKCVEPFAADIAAQQAALKVNAPPLAQTIPTVPELNIEEIKKVTPAEVKKPVLGKLLIASGAAAAVAASAVYIGQNGLPSLPANPFTSAPVVVEAPKAPEPPKVEAPVAPPPKVEVATPAPTPTPAPVSVPGDSIDNECTAPIVQKKTVRVIYVRVPQTNDKGVTEYVYIKKPVVVYKYVPSPKPLDNVATPAPVVPTPTPTAPTPAPTKPAVVADKGVLIGYRGLNNIFDQAAFEDFAKAMGYSKTLVIDEWEQKSAVNSSVDALKDFKTPYGLYGFSLGGDSAKLMVKTVKAMQAKGKPATLPNAVYIIGASQVINFKDAFDGIPEVMFWFHANTKHDVDGVFIKAPHTGAGNIQQLVADSVKKG